MLKLYKSNYTDDELLTMAEHCLHFCPIPPDKRLRKECFFHVSVTEFVVIFSGSANTV